MGRYSFLLKDEKTYHITDMHLECLLPNAWPYHLIYVRGKGNVLHLHNLINWEMHDKRRILFMVDRDLSGYLNEDMNEDINIYTTDFYSIENSIINVEMLLFVLEDIYGITLQSLEAEKVFESFTEMTRQFYSLIMPIMAWIIAWRMKKLPIQLNDIQIKKYITLRNGSFSWHSKILDQNELRDNLSTDLNTSCSGHLTRQKNVLKLLRNESNPKSFTRGKWEMWCFIKILKHIRENINAYSDRYTRPPSHNLEISDTNALQVLGPRASSPKSLKYFLHNSALQFIAEYSSQEESIAQV